MKRFYQEQRLNANSIIYTSAIRPRENPESRSQISSAEEQEHLAIPRQEANQLTAQQCTRVTVAIQSVRDTRNMVQFGITDFSGGWNERKRRSQAPWHLQLTDKICSSPNGITKDGRKGHITRFQRHSHPRSPALADRENPSLIPEIFIHRSFRFIV